MCSLLPKTYIYPPAYIISERYILQKRHYLASFMNNSCTGKIVTDNVTDIVEENLDEESGVPWSGGDQDGGPFFPQARST
jgi:hypothetical protein